MGNSKSKKPKASSNNNNNNTTTSKGVGTQNNTSKDISSSNLSSNSQNNKSDIEVSQNNLKKSAKNNVVEEKKEISQVTIEDLFNRFAKGKDMMEADDVIEFFDELKLDPQDASAVVLCFHFKAAMQCYFSRQEFIGGFKELKCNTMSDLQSKVPSFASELNSPSVFKEIYEFAFLWSREALDKKNLDLETACDMLELLLGTKFPYFTEKFITFLKEQHSYKCVTRDQWANFLEFCKLFNPDLSNYDENASWPVMIDDFVEWLKEQKNE